MGCLFQDRATLRSFQCRITAYRRGSSTGGPIPREPLKRDCSVAALAANPYPPIAPWNVATVIDGPLPGGMALRAADAPLSRACHFARRWAVFGFHVSFLKTDQQAQQKRRVGVGSDAPLRCAPRSQGSRTPGVLLVRLFQQLVLSCPVLSCRVASCQVALIFFIEKRNFIYFESTEKSIVLWTEHTNTD